LLLENGADLEGTDWSGHTPLFSACGNGPELVQLLLDYGADIEAQERNGLLTSLHVAVWDCSLEVTELLLTRGADMEGRDDDGCTPLHHASTRNRLEFIELLMNQGANLEARNGRGDAPLYSVCKNSDRHDDNGVYLLLDGGANMQARNNDCRTPLHVATQSECCSKLFWIEVPIWKQGTTVTVHLCIRHAPNAIVVSFVCY
jgi:ankyrin repeat protein